MRVTSSKGAQKVQLLTATAQQQPASCSPGGGVASMPRPIEYAVSCGKVGACFLPGRGLLLVAQCWQQQQQQWQHAPSHRRTATEMPHSKGGPAQLLVYALIQQQQQRIAGR
jgi:hypothetical protein